MRSVSVVVPCYKSSKTIGHVVDLTIEEFQRLGIVEYQFVLVNDCSPDGGDTYRELVKLANGDPNIIAIDLAKNVGQHNALMAGLNYAEKEFVLCMDDDMQTHPSQIHILFEEIEKGYDVVYGYYPKKKHGFWRNIGSKVNFMTVRLLIGKPKSLHTSSFFVMRHFVRDYIVRYTCSYAYLQGLVLRCTQNITCVPVQHFKRQEGKSGYTLKKLIGLWSNIMGFSIVPLRLCTYTGYILSACSLIAAVAVLIRKVFINPNMTVGWPSLIITICFMFGLTFMFLGLIGEYIGRMFLAINNQPQYVVRSICRKTDVPSVGEKDEEK